MPLARFLIVGLIFHSDSRYEKNSTMKAGSASADITPNLGIIPQGHAGAGPAREILAPLEIRSIVFEDGEESVAIVTLDLIGTSRDMTRRIRRRVREECGIPEHGILLASSHTHCAPPALDLMGPKPDPKYLLSVEDAVVDAVVSASSDLQDVTLGCAGGSAGFNVNRRAVIDEPDGRRRIEMRANHGGIVDRRSRVMRVDKESGDPLAVLFHYSCHPTTMGGGAGYISPDYPGLARAGIEKELDCPALFLPGCFGNVRPRIVDKDGAFLSATTEELRGVAKLLADSVIGTARGLRTAHRRGLTGRIEDITVPFGEPMPRPELEEFATADSDDKVAALMRDWSRDVLSMIREDRLPQSVSSEMQFLGIGPLAIVTIPGEPVQEIGHAIESLPPPGTCEETWPCGYSNDMLGYLCTARHHLEGGYEPTAYPYFMKPLPYLNEQTVLCEGAQTLLRIDEGQT